MPGFCVFEEKRRVREGQCVRKVSVDLHHLHLLHLPHHYHLHHRFHHHHGKKGFYPSENGSVFSHHTPDPIRGACVSSTPLYCRSTCSSASVTSTTCGEDEQNSVESQDSGIPTLELSSPEVTEEKQSIEPLSQRQRDAPATLKLEAVDEGGASSQVRGGALVYRDSTSVCSTSSLSTDFSATLSLGNDDAAGDFVVTSDSSAVVDFHDFSDFSQFPQATAINIVPRDHPQQHHCEAVAKKESPIVNFFNRRLFGKNSPQQIRRVTKENEKAGGSASPRQSVRKHLEFEPLSTTALILEHRPANLPAKPAEEAQKHRQQYEEMVAHAKKREMKEAQKRRRQFEERVRLEESIGNAAHTWSQEILPNWQSMHSSKRTRDLWWQGIPPSVRGRVWSLAIGNELNITHELYDICLARAKVKWSASPSSISRAESNTAGDAGLSHADREASLELIKLDISRTFPSLCIFQQGGPYHDVLHSILGAYTCYRPDVGYVQGMSFIAAVLILNMNTADAFIAFANLLNKPCQMAFYRVDHSLMLTYFAAFEVFFEENLPKLFAHFKSNNLTPDIYLIDWIFTLYSKSLPLDVACRVWDVFCRDGEEFLFRTALGILRFYSEVLTHMDFIHMAQFLTRLPEQNSTHTQSHTLFSCIGSINMSCRNRTWTQVLQTLQKDPEHSSPVLKH
ncbi:TBC1 domain family member 14 isoform X2 [Tachysurus vachellii]|uniref:TBC1 domain family member 14 isoform X2 n=1 Tax=Tachysurus vachellii TaxID=175792 RepID=UPI00296ABEEA|nr:TBC1 domain family member 14 isoform X2 [Tachysurus vachellii]